MYSGFAVYSLERELSSLEKRKVLVKDKIDTCKKSGGPKNIDVTKQLEQLRLPPIPNRCGTPPEKAAKPKKKKVVVPPKGFDLNNLENLWQENGKIDKNKKENVMYAPITLEPKVPIGVETRLKLTEEINFSMTNFDKVNKGLNNSSINCYMNTCLQSLIACPAFFNMLTAVSEAEKDTYEALTHSREIF